MKAVVRTEYGGPEVLRLVEIEKPVPAADEVLIRVHAASLNAADWRLMRGDPYLFRLSMGFPRPKSPGLGADVAGRVEAVGGDVKRFRPGDEVFADVFESGYGSLAEYVSVAEHFVVAKPANLTMEQAAAVPLAGVTALQAVRDKGGIRPGHQVLVYGASGGVGTFAVQIAKAYGAEVTAVVSTRNVEPARSIGADHAIDYKHEDFTKNGRRYDLIIAANGARSLGDYRGALKDGGVLVTAGGSMGQIFRSLLLGPVVSALGDKKFVSVVAKPNGDDLTVLKELAEAGKLTPVIDECYPLAETAAAMRYLLEEHARGKVVISVGE